MRTTILLATCLLFSFHNYIFAQKEYNEVDNIYSDDLVYRISGRQALTFLKHTIQPEDTSYFVQPVGIYSDSLFNKLPAGNYIKVYSEGTSLHLEYIPKTPFHFYLENNNSDLMIQLLSPGTSQPIQDAHLIVDNRQIPFETQGQAYTLRHSNRKGIISVIYRSDTFYYIIKNQDIYPSSRTYTMGWYGYRGLNQVLFPVRSIKELPRDALYYLKNKEFSYEFRNKWRTIHYNYFGPRYREDYSGSVFTNKPKYLPGDTVKAKIYLYNYNKNKWFRTPLHAFLVSKNKTIPLSSIVQKRRHVGYELQFVLHDSMNLMIDRDCRVVLKDRNFKEIHSFNIRMEHYELKRSVLGIQVEGNKHIRNIPFPVSFSAEDDNGLPVYDATAHIAVRFGRLEDRKADHYIPYNIWEYSTPLSDGKKEIIIPDSLFRNIRMDYTIHAKISTSTNEIREKVFNVQYRTEDNRITYSNKADSLYIQYFKNNTAIAAPAIIQWYGIHDNLFHQDSIQLPYTFRIDPRVSYYEVISGEEREMIKTKKYEPVFINRSSRTHDSLIIDIQNPYGHPFTFQIYKGKKEIERGYNSVVQRRIAATEDALYFIRVQYLWNDQVHSEGASFPLLKNRIRFESDFPELVYPGQEVDVSITALDYKDKPVKDLNILAYAFTGKFNEDIDKLPLVNKQKVSVYNNIYQEITGDFREKSAKLNYPFWHQRLSLDTLSNYRLMYPGSTFEPITFPTADSSTQIAPIPVKDGKIEEVYYVHINGKPVYFGTTTINTPYSFVINDPQQLHTITIRTKQHLITIDSFKATPFVRSLFTIDINDIHASTIRIRDLPDTLSSKEYSDILRHTLFIKRERLPYQTMFYGNDYSLLPVYNMDYRHYLVSNGVSYMHENINVHSVGPVTNRLLMLSDKDSIFFPFELEDDGTYFYQFRDNTLVIKPFTHDKRFYPKKPGLNDWAINPEKIDILRKQYIEANKPRIDFKNDQSGNAAFAFTIPDIDSPGHEIAYDYAVLVNKDSAQYIYILEDSYTDFKNIQSGNYSFILFNNEVQYIQDDIMIRPDGFNFAYFPVVSFQKKEEGINIDSLVLLYSKSYATDSLKANTIRNHIMDKSGAVKGYTFYGTILDHKGEPFIAAEITAIEDPSISNMTDENGDFSIFIPENSYISGFKISILGDYDTTIRDLQPHIRNIIRLDSIPFINDLEETVIIGSYYSTTKMKSVGTAMSFGSEAIDKFSLKDITKAIEGSAAGIMIRGNGSINAASVPLYVINGTPFTGDITTLDPNLIERVVILKDENATSLYGSRGANGVIVIITKEGIALPVSITSHMEKTGAEDPLMPESASSLRHNFRDDAFWQSDLMTDEQGKVTFRFRFPDDITSWKTNILAANDQMQTGQQTFTIRSFKPVSASLSAPHFFIEGDKAILTGNTNNYKSDTISPQIAFYINDSLTYQSNIRLYKNHTDSLYFSAQTTDSVRLKYILSQADGYYDGEERKVPVYAQGTYLARGQFLNLGKGDTSFLIPETGEEDTLYLSATASLQDIVLEEINMVRDYPYLCNEQLASKILSLLAKEKMGIIFGRPISSKEHKYIQKNVNMLVERQKEDGYWGWWEQDASILWMSDYILYALTEAGKMGYTISSERGLAGQDHYRIDDRNNSVSLLWILHILGKETDYPYYISCLEKDNSLSRTERIRLLLLKHKLGLPYDKQYLESNKETDIYGNIYWADTLASIHQNDIIATKYALDLLMEDTTVSIDKHKVVNWLLQNKKVSGYNNTYESANIITSFVALFKSLEKNELGPSLWIKGKTDTMITTFPYQEKITGAAIPVSITKKGAAPVYFSYYKRFHDTSSVQSGNNYVINTSFIHPESGKAINILKAGEPVRMQIEIEAFKEADFIMIEVPIPSGCSYTNKKQYYGREVHREYFYHKTCVFARKLEKGRHTFSIDLTARYSGTFVLNPAKVELMYFPTFYGKTGIKNVDIE